MFDDGGEGGDWVGLGAADIFCNNYNERLLSG
jgi:hypothetical protein